MLICSLTFACATLMVVPSALAATPATMVGEGVISTSADEFGGALTPDGQTIYFDRSIPRSVFYVICVSHLVDGRWTTPRVAPFSGQYRDSDPVLSADGKRLFFASDRVWPGQKEPNFDIWFVELQGPDANVPHRIESDAVNSEANEYFASDTNDGTIYVASDRSGGLGPANIYRVPRAGDGYGDAEQLPEPLNAKDVFTIEALVAPDESFMFIGCFGRPGAGNSDLFVSRNRGGKWSPPEPLTSINTPAREYSPRITPDGKSLIFASERGLPTEQQSRPITYRQLLERAATITNGLGNIYTIPLSELGIGATR